MKQRSSDLLMMLFNVTFMVQTFLFFTNNTLKLHKNIISIFMHPDQSHPKYLN